MQTLTIQLTDEQRKFVKDATGENVAEVRLDLAASGQITEEQLGQVRGGATIGIGTTRDRTIHAGTL